MQTINRKPLNISYIRFSRGEQAKGNSLKRQIRIGEELANEHGLKISTNLRDLGVSAFRGRHAREGKFADFLQLIREGEIPAGSALIVESLDRLSRQNLLDAQDQWNAIVRAGVRIITKEFVFQKSDKPEVMLQNMMLALMIMARAFDESKRKSDRSSDNWRQKQQSGKIVTAMLPSWLEMRHGKIVTRPQHVAMMRKIFDRAAQGWGIWRLLKFANNECREFTRNGWARSSMQRLLCNRAVLGEYQPKKQRYIEDAKRVRDPIGDPIKDYFPRVISDKLFYAVQAQIAKRRKTGGPAGGYINLFSGLLYSIEDGSRIYMADNGRGYRYTPASVLERRTNAPKIGFPVSAFESAFLFRLADPDIFAQPNQKHHDRQIEIGAAEGELNAVTKQISKVKSRMMDTDSEVDSILGLLRDLDAKKKVMEANIDGLKQQVASAPSPATIQDIMRIMGEALKGTISDDERLHLRASIARVVQRIDCYFEKAGWADYTCGTQVTLTNGKQFDFTFQALRVDRTKRDAKGHPVKGAISDGVPQYSVNVAPWG